MKKHWVFVVIPVLACILTACGGAKKDDLVKTTPEEILKAYQNGTSAGDQQFKGKKVEVTGIVGETDKTDNGIPYLTFASENEVTPTFNFRKDQEKVVASLKPGEKVTLTCVGAGELLRTPAFNDCVISGNAKTGGK